MRMIKVPAVRTERTPLAHERFAAAIADKYRFRPGARPVKASTLVFRQESKKRSRAGRRTTVVHVHMPPHSPLLVREKVVEVLRQPEIRERIVKIQGKTETKERIVEREKLIERERFVERVVQRHLFDVRTAKRVMTEQRLLREWLLQPQQLPSDEAIVARRGERPVRSDNGAVRVELLPPVHTARRRPQATATSVRVVAAEPEPQRRAVIAYAASDSRLQAGGHEGEQASAAPMGGLRGSAVDAMAVPEQAAALIPANAVAVRARRTVQFGKLPLLVPAKRVQEASGKRAGRKRSEAETGEAARPKARAKSKRAREEEARREAELAAARSHVAARFKRVLLVRGDFALHYARRQEADTAGRDRDTAAETTGAAPAIQRLAAETSASGDRLMKSGESGSTEERRSSETEDFREQAQAAPDARRQRSASGSASAAEAMANAAEAAGQGDAAAEVGGLGKAKLLPGVRAFIGASPLALTFLAKSRRDADASADSHESGAYARLPLKRELRGADSRTGAVQPAERNNGQELVKIVVTLREPDGHTTESGMELAQMQHEQDSGTALRTVAALVDRQLLGSMRRRVGSSASRTEGESPVQLRGRIRLQPGEAGRALPLEHTRTAAGRVSSAKETKPIRAMLRQAADSGPAPSTRNVQSGQFATQVQGRTAAKLHGSAELIWNVSGLRSDTAPRRTAASERESGGGVNTGAITSMPPSGVEPSPSAKAVTVFSDRENVGSSGGRVDARAGVARPLLQLRRPAVPAESHRGAAVSGVGGLGAAAESMDAHGRRQAEHSRLAGQQQSGAEAAQASLPRVTAEPVGASGQSDATAAVQAGLPRAAAEPVRNMPLQLRRRESVGSEPLGIVAMRRQPASASGQERPTTAAQAGLPRSATGPTRTVPLQLRRRESVGSEPRSIVATWRQPASAAGQGGAAAALQAGSPGGPAGPTRSAPLQLRRREAAGSEPRSGVATQQQLASASSQGDATTTAASQAGLPTSTAAPTRNMPLQLRRRESAGSDAPRRQTAAGAFAQERSRLAATAAASPAHRPELQPVSPGSSVASGRPALALQTRRPAASPQDDAAGPGEPLAATAAAWRSEPASRLTLAKPPGPGIAKRSAAPQAALAPATLEMRRSDKPQPSAAAEQQEVQVQAPPQIDPQQLQRAIEQMPQLKPDKLAEQVYQALMKRMKLEQRLRGY